MKKIVTLLALSLLTLFILVGCSSSNSDYSSDTESTEETSNNQENVNAVIATVVEKAVEENEGWSDAKFPWSFDDYHISKIGTDTYNTYGEFTRHGNIYKFDMDMETDGDNVTLKSYSVTSASDD